MSLNSNSTTQELTTTQPGALVAIRPDRNPVIVYLASLGSHHSRRTMQTALDNIAFLRAAGHLPGNPQERKAARGMAIRAGERWAELDRAYTQAIRTALAERYKPATANKMLSALRRVLKEAWRLGYMTSDDYRRAADVGAVKGSTIPAGRDLSSGELQALFDACFDDAGRAGARDAALLAFLRAGLRRAEVVALDVSDLDVENGAIKIHGKGNKERTAYLDPNGLQAVKDWLSLRGDEPGALLLPVSRGNNILFEQTDKNGETHPARLSSQAVYKVLKKRADEAGLKEFSPHDFRRTFVGDLLDAGVDIATTAKLAGHANVQTTARYDRRTEETKRKAAGMLHTPYRGRARMR